MSIGIDKYVFEPAVAGTSPILVNKILLYSDLLCSTLASADSKSFRSPFGHSTLKQKYDFFTGKPNIPGLGYHFPLRNYNAENGNGIPPTRSATRTVGNNPPVSILPDFCL